MTKDDFQKKLESNKPLLMDGATGSVLFTRGMPRGVLTEAWILDHPEVIEELQRQYVEAGSDMVYAPTFRANRAAMKDFGMEDRVAEINRRLVEISRRAVGDRALVAGDISMTGLVPVSAGGTASDDEIYEIYREQILALAESGVDLIGIETMVSLDEAAIALGAVLELTDLPVTCTMTVEADGRAIYGGDAVEAMETFQAMGASAAGINCSAGPDQIVSIVRGMAAVAEIPVIAKPNAGMPFIDDQGNAIYSMGPDEFALHMKELAQAGATVLGGCCGTDPTYIRKLALAVRGKLIG